MAPKGTKRASTGGIERAAKKAAASNCATVIAELRKVEALPESCRTMLVSMAEPALTTYAAERHEFLAQCVAMIAKTLSMMENTLENNVSQEQIKVDSADAEKAARSVTFSTAEAKLMELQQAANSAKETLEADTLTEHAARADLVTVQKSLDENARELARNTEKKTRLQNLKSLYEPLKAAKLSGHEGRKTLNSVTKILEEFELEDILVTTLGEALHKEVPERGTFDCIVVEHVEKKLSEWIASMDLSINSGESLKAELTASRTAAEQHHIALLEKLSAGKTAVQATNTAVSEGKTTLKEAEGAVKSFEKDLATAGKKLVEAKTSLESFKEGALKAFLELKELAPPPLPVPEESVPEEKEVPEQSVAEEKAVPTIQEP